MKKLFFVLLLISTQSFADNGECYSQRNPIGFTNYDICEVTGTGYICVTPEGKENGGISCFPASKVHELSAEKKITHSKKPSEDGY